MVPVWKCWSSGKRWKAGSMRRSERKVYSWELYWIFREITPSLQDVIICNFLALSQTYEKRRGLEAISPKASSEGLIRTRCTLWTWGATWKKGYCRWIWPFWQMQWKDGNEIKQPKCWNHFLVLFPSPVWWSSLERNFLWSLCPCGKLPTCLPGGSGNSSALGAPAAWASGEGDSWPFGLNTTSILLAFCIHFGAIQAYYYFSYKLCKYWLVSGHASLCPV